MIKMVRLMCIVMMLLVGVFAVAGASASELDEAGTIQEYDSLVRETLLETFPSMTTAEQYAILQKADETLVSELKATLTEEQLLRLEVYIPAYAHLEGCAEGCTGCECACHTSLRAIIQLQAMQYMEEALLWDETTLSGTMFIMYNNLGKLYDMAREALANGEITQEEYDLINEDMNSYYTKLFMIFYKFGFDPYMTSPVYDFNDISGGKIINAANGYSADGDGYVNFELNQPEVLLNGTVVIPSGVKVKIRINDSFASSLPNGSHVTIKRNSGNALLMFRILGELKVEGTQSGDHRIIFDGNENMVGCGFLLDYQDGWGNNTSDADGSYYRPRLEMDWATIQNMKNDVGSHFNGNFAGVNNAATIPSWDCSSAIMIRHGDIDLWEVHINDNSNTNDNGIIRAYARKWDNAPGNYYATIRLDSCAIYRNSSGDVYGGIVKAGGPEVACVMDVTGGVAFDNRSSGWGGVFLWAANTQLPDGRPSKATIDGFTAYQNTAQLGGVISCESVMEVKNCTLRNNSAKAGGAIAAFPFTRDQVSDTGANACGLTLTGGNRIYENEAKDGENNQFTFENKIYSVGGGGIWLYMNIPGWDCSLDIGTGNEINNNKARNGGGVMVTHVNGNVTNLNISGANIHDNSADLNGGGLALINAKLTASSGNISNNTASGDGGGVYSVLSTNTYVEPKPQYQSDVTINANMNIQNNTAKNGGGIYLDGGGTLTVNGGFITGNKATGLPAGLSGDGNPPHYTNNTTNSGYTAYNESGNYNAGVGGGVYVYNGTMTITGTTIGLYDNTADFAADDIYMKQAEGTSIKFPLVYEMSGVESSIQGWFEDYAIGDSRYTDGTHWKRDEQPIMRYRHADAEETDANKILYRGTGEESNKYVCLTLGQAVGDMKVTKQVEGTTDNTTEFEFTVTVSDGTIGTVVIGDTHTPVNNKTATFRLKHDQTATLTGLTYYTHVTVTETPVNGYNTQVKVGETILDAAGVEFAFQDYDVVVTNTFAGIPVHVTKAGDALDWNETFTFQPIVNDTPGTQQTIKKGETFTFYVDKNDLVEVKELGAANYRTSLHVDTKMEAEDGAVSNNGMKMANRDAGIISGGAFIGATDTGTLTLNMTIPASKMKVGFQYADHPAAGTRNYRFKVNGTAGNSTEKESSTISTPNTGDWETGWTLYPHNEVFEMSGAPASILFDPNLGTAPNLDYFDFDFDIDSLTLGDDSSRASGQFSVMGETTFTFTNTPVTHVTVSKEVRNGNQSQSFAFTPTIGGTAGSSFNLTHGQSHTISGLSYGTSVQVSETPLANMNTSYQITTRYEAEDAALEGTANVANGNGVSGGAYVQGIGNKDEPRYRDQNTLTFTVYAQQEGWHTLRLGNVDTTGGNYSFTINGKANDDETKDGQYLYSLRSVENCNGKLPDIPINLNAGQNTIKIGGWYWTAPPLDYIEIIEGPYTGTDTGSITLHGATTIHYINEQTVDVTVSKEVKGSVETENYRFTGKIIGGSSEDFTLQNNGSKTFTNLPYGTKVQVDETDMGGSVYTTYTITQRLEAENATLNGARVNAAFTSFSGSGGVGYIQGSEHTVTFAVNAPVAGEYTIRLRQNQDDVRSFALWVNSNNAIAVAGMDNNDWGDTWSTVETSVQLSEGLNTIKVGGNGSNHAPNLDYVELVYGPINCTETGETPEITLNGDTTIHYVNDMGFELPATGGSGTYLYTMGGLLLMAAGAGLLYSKKRRREGAGER